MALYLYLKSDITTAQTATARLKDRLGGAIFLLIGFTVATTQLWPIAKWQFYTLPKIKSSILLNPQTVSQQMDIKDVVVKTTDDGFSYFAASGNDTGTFTTFDNFEITIPKLKIKKATVLINSHEFTKNLAHFPGSALPGTKGNVFITGHSALPQFFNPNDYNNIFSTLNNLENNDIIDVNYNNRLYTYQVVGKDVVDPDDVSVLLPKDNIGKFLTLMTCVPPGLNSQRLIITSVLVEGTDEID